MIPTTISDEQAKDFQDLYFKKYSKTITLEEARELGLSLMGMIYVVYR